MKTSNLVFIGLFLLSANVSYSQDPNPSVQPSGKFITSVTGGVRGNLVRQSGAPISGAIIICIEESGRVFKGITDSNGDFHVGLLPPGWYIVRAMKEDFEIPAAPRVRVIAGKWVIPPNQSAYCGTTSARNGFMRFSHASIDIPRYDSPTSQERTFTQEDLRGLPIFGQVQ